MRPPQGLMVSGMQEAYDLALARFYMWAQTDTTVFLVVHIPTGNWPLQLLGYNYWSARISCCYLLTLKGINKSACRHRRKELSLPQVIKHKVSTFSKAACYFMSNIWPL